MKKIAKLSLVAAVAVAGLSTANAQPLEEAIKNVDVSGTAVYRYNDYKNDVTDSSGNSNNYKIGLSLSSKINEDFKANTRFLVSNGVTASTNDGSFASLDSSDNGDQVVDVTLSQVYFTYTGLANTTVNVGKQGLTTPWTVAVDSDSNEQTGTGILAMSNLGAVTLAGAYFNQTNLDDSGDVTIGNGSEDVYTIGAISTLGPVTVDAWYLDMADAFDTYTIGAKAGFDVSGVKLGADVRYTSLDLDATNTDNSLAKITLTAAAGMFDAKLAYATTDKDGGIAALDNDAVTNIQGWSVSANDKADADFYQASLGAKVLPNLHVSANYTNVEYKGVDSTNTAADVEETEV